MDNDRANEEDKKLINDLFEAFKLYEVSLKIRSDYDQKERGKTPLNKKKQTVEEYQIAHNYLSLLKTRATYITFLETRFFDIFDQILSTHIKTRKIHLKNSIKEEIKILTDTITVASKAVSLKKMTQENYDTFSEAGNKLSSRISHIEQLTDVKARRSSWDVAFYSIAAILSLGMIITGIALLATGVGFAPGMALLATGFVGLVATGVMSGVMDADDRVKIFSRAPKKRTLFRLEQLESIHAAARPDNARIQAPVRPASLMFSKHDKKHSVKPKTDLKHHRHKK
jgi:hypothetical protein